MSNGQQNNCPSGIGLKSEIDKNNTRMLLPPGFTLVRNVSLLIAGFFWHAAESASAITMDKQLASHTRSICTPAT